MQTQAIEKFSMWARNKLREGVEQRAYDYALDPAAPNAEPKDATTVNGRVLSNEERAMRTELAGRIERDGYAQFVEEMAYTWFNRMVAIRFMELHDYLPSHVRIFSSAEDGAKFSPQALSEALTVCIDGLDRDCVFACMDAADDEALFRELLLAQCNELAGFLPRVFGRVGGADALMLPANLLKPEGMPAHMVGDIPVELWDDVEILGWMYQFYNKELKDAFFASKRKAAPEDLAPATQLFTPEWIVRYMVDNSLGRLWMLNHPESHLIERAQAENPADRLMEYYIQPDEEHEDFIRVASPEDITFCDPACGSGHILVYAFKMLVAIYEECGYRTRDIPELILRKNLSGMEIDPRAAQIATLALAMCAREHDRRFFSRNVKANICVLHDAEINADALSLTSPLRQKPELLDTLARLGEVGSLFAPTSDDIAALEADLRESMTDDIFAAKANENVQTALNLCRALCRRFDVVVANPPYMGSSSFNPFMSKWVKKNYPDVKSDLFAAFIVRIMGIAEDHGEVGIMSPFVWMFIGSYEKLRNKLIDEKTITSLIQLEYSGFAGATVPICTFTYHNSHIEGYKGGYVRLSDFVGAAVQAPKALEAIHNPACGWFYRADATTFHDIPGSPIAYWASKNTRNAFTDGEPLGARYQAVRGLDTGNNDKYLRRFWEVEVSKTYFEAFDESLRSSDAKFTWFPCDKGGGFRRWDGKLNYVVNWSNQGKLLKSSPKANVRNEQFYFLPFISWPDVSSAVPSFCMRPSGLIIEHCANAITQGRETETSLLLGLLNSSCITYYLSLISPTIHFGVGEISSLPLPAKKLSNCNGSKIETLTNECLAISKTDWDSQETSWDFKRSPLI